VENDQPINRAMVNDQVGNPLRSLRLRCDRCGFFGRDLFGHRSGKWVPGSREELVPRVREQLTVDPEISGATLGMNFW
jgi:hypothetical protein